MNQSLREKTKIALYGSLGLLLSLGLAAGAHSMVGNEASASMSPAEGAPAQMAQPLAVSQSTAAEERRAESVDIPADPAALAALNRGLVEVAGKVTPAVVSVDTRGTPDQRLPSPLEDLFGPRRNQEPSPFDVPLGRGSGFIVSSDGYILTNNHVVARAERIDVELVDGRSLPAKLIGRDPTTDVAVLKVEADDLPQVSLGNSEAMEVGELVLAIGNPGTAFGSALPFTVTTGIISAKGRSLGIIQRAAGGSAYAIEDLLQTDAVINPGNSGGPLVNHRGEVIGINTAIASVTGYYQGYGFAIPISLAKNVMEDLIEYGRVRRAAMGVSVAQIGRADARYYKLDAPRGVLIQDFTDDSPAKKAGLEREDVIVSVEGIPIDRVGQLQRLIASYEPDDRVEVKVIRFGEEKEFSVRLMEAPVPQPEVAAVAEPRRSTTLLGVQVRDLNPELAAEIGLPERLRNIDGVVITDVARFGPAGSAGLGRGFIIQRLNGEEIHSVEDFDRALEKLEPGDVVSIDAAAPDRDGDLVNRIFNFELPQD